MYCSVPCTLCNCVCAFVIIPPSGGAARLRDTAGADVGAGAGSAATSVDESICTALLSVGHPC